MARPPSPQGLLKLCLGRRRAKANFHPSITTRIDFLALGTAAAASRYLDLVLVVKLWLDQGQ